MTHHDDAAAGMQAAIDAIRAIAIDGDEGALAVLNRLSHPEAVWAAATLLSALRESVAARVGDKRHKVARALLDSADRSEREDIVLTQVQLILDETEA